MMMSIKYNEDNKKSKGSILLNFKIVFLHENLRCKKYKSTKSPERIEMTLLLLF